MGKKILFLCGSPRRKKSASRRTAEYLARFLDYNHEFLDLAASRSSPDPHDLDPAFRQVVQKMEEAAVVIWTCGAWGVFVPHHFQYLFEKMFVGERFDFSGRIAATVMTSVHVMDDYILEKMRTLCEHLGFGYIGDVSAAGNPFFGYTPDEEQTESSCRMLADRINRALDENYLPPRSRITLERRFLAPDHHGDPDEFTAIIDKSSSEKHPEPGTAGRDHGCNDSRPTILVICGNNPAKHASYGMTVDALKKGSQNRVEVIDLEAEALRPCVGCFLCAFNGDGRCVQKDGYATIRNKMHSADAIVLVATCAVTGVDRHMKGLLDRSWEIAHCPSLQGKYGFTVALGGGPLGRDASWNLAQSLLKWGVTSLGTLYPEGCSDGCEFRNQLIWMTKELDRALEKKWEINPRFTTIAISALLKDLALENGMMMRFDYRYHKEHGLFDRPKWGVGGALLRLLFRSRHLEKKLIAMQKERIEKKRQSRLQKLLAGGLSQGKGTDIGRVRPQKRAG